MKAQLSRDIRLFSREISVRPIYLPNRHTAQCTIKLSKEGLISLLVKWQ